jgi:hypothetical protein
VRILGPLLALAGVIIGAGLTFAFSTLGEVRRERWALRREWREKKLQAFGDYIAAVKRLRDIAQRMAAAVGLDDQAPPLARASGLEALAEANMARSASFETVNLIAGKEVIEAGREVNRAIWRLEWFARGDLDDTDRDGWLAGYRAYHAAINNFHERARFELGITDEFSPRSTEESPRVQYERDRLNRRPGNLSE